MLTHQWLKPTGSKRVWELNVDVGQAKLLGRRTDLEGRGWEGGTNVSPETYLPVRRAENKQAIAIR